MRIQRKIRRAQYFKSWRCVIDEKKIQDKINYFVCRIMTQKKKNLMREVVW
jgi:hypothetical protein